MPRKIAMIELQELLLELRKGENSVEPRSLVQIVGDSGYIAFEWKW